MKGAALVGRESAEQDECRDGSVGIAARGGLTSALWYDDHEPGLGDEFLAEVSLMVAPRLTKQLASSSTPRASSTHWPWRQTSMTRLSSRVLSLVLLLMLALDV